MAVDETQALLDQRLQSLTGALMEARTDRIAKEAVVKRMRALPAGELLTFPQGRGEPARAVAAGARWPRPARRRPGSRSPWARSIPSGSGCRRASRASTRRSRPRCRASLRTAENDYETARQHEASLEVELEAAKRTALRANRKGMELGSLRRGVEQGQKLLRDLETRTQETGLETQLRDTNVRIVEKASVPRAPILPRKTRNYQLALVLRPRHRDRPHHPVRAHGQHGEDARRRHPAARPALPGHGSHRERRARVASAEPGRPGPAHRHARAAVGGGRGLPRHPHQPDLLRPVAQGAASSCSAAPTPGEGKTTSVANLAASLAQNGARVLAVDADLRRPTLHRHFGLEHTPGLSDLVVGRAKMAEVVRSTSIAGLSILPCGYIPPNPAELLGSDALREVLQGLRKKHDWVLVDAPPILAMADTPVLCPFVDGLVLVVWSESSSRPALRRALDQIERVGGKLTGVVLNKVDLQRNAYYYGQHYGEYYRKYYGGDPAPPINRPYPNSNSL